MGVCLFHLFRGFLKPLGRLVAFPQVCQAFSQDGGETWIADRREFSLGQAAEVFDRPGVLLLSEGHAGQKPFLPGLVVGS